MSEKALRDGVIRRPVDIEHSHPTHPHAPRPKDGHRGPEPDPPPKVKRPPSDDQETE